MPLPLRRGGRGPAEGGRASDKNRNSIPPCRSADVLTQVRDYFVRHIDFEQSVGHRTDRLRRLRYEAGQALSRLFWGEEVGALDLVLRLAAAIRSAPSTARLGRDEAGRAEPHAPHDRGGWGLSVMRRQAINSALSRPWPCRPSPTPRPTSPTPRPATSAAICADVHPAANLART